MDKCRKVLSDHIRATTVEGTEAHCIGLAVIRTLTLGQLKKAIEVRHLEVPS